MQVYYIEFPSRIRFFLVEYVFVPLALDALLMECYWIAIAGLGVLDQLLHENAVRNKCRKKGWKRGARDTQGK